MKTINRVYTGSAVAMGLALTNPVYAAAVPIDVTEVTAQFGALNTAQAAVGALILIAAGIALTFRWVKGMFF
jgi:hypothetical protein